MNTVGIWLTNIWITEFLNNELSLVQYSDHHLNTGLVFKWWSEYRTKFSLVFKWHSDNRPFGDWTTFNHLNTRLVWYSDPHCTFEKCFLILQIVLNRLCIFLLVHFEAFNFNNSWLDIGIWMTATSGIWSWAMFHYSNLPEMSFICILYEIPL